MGLVDLGHEADPVLTRIVEEDKVPWYRKRNLRYLYFLLCPTCMGIEITSGFDSQMINGLQFIPSWNKYFGELGVDAAGKETYALKAELLGIVAAAYSLGAILSVPFVPIVAQKFGRRWSIMLGSMIMVLGSILQGFAVHAAMYIIARMLLGFGIVFAIVSGSALIGELSYPKERPIMTSLFNSSWYAGSLIASGITVRTATINTDWGWRIPSLLQACPSLIQMLFIFFLPESPRYLISKDRRDEAFDVLVKYHAEGDRNSVFVCAELTQIETTIKLELESAKQSWMDMFRTPGMRRRTYLASAMGIFTQWSGNTLISYYLSKILAMIGYTDTYTKTMINLGNTAWSFITSTIIALVVARYKRRTMFLTCACSMLCVYIGWTVSMQRAMLAYETNRPNKAAAITTLFFIYLYSPCYNIGNNALTYTYLVELFPYADRSRGIAVEQVFGRAANFFTTYVNPIGMANVGWKYLIMYCVTICIEIVVVYFFYPETQGRTLEELAFLFEDKELADKATIAVEKTIHFEAHDESRVEEVRVIGPNKDVEK
ncbi:MFS sugar transporter protein [Rutstroemia sp. NJR-2017a WRK4]|nr:MFS sugar transporter protein [Rutstroemia sp. NJR-2017a WRK4]